MPRLDRILLFNRNRQRSQSYIMDFDGKGEFDINIYDRDAYGNGYVKWKVDRSLG
jgi:hypothetical protein